MNLEPPLREGGSFFGRIGDKICRLVVTRSVQQPGSRNHFSEGAKSPGNEAAIASHHCQRGDSKMIVLKLIALVLGAGVLVSLFTPEFDADLVLAIVACFS